MVNTRIGSVKSPWLAMLMLDDIHTIPISHGEGRFVAPKEVIEELFENGQVFSQYVDQNRQGNNANTIIIQMVQCMRLKELFLVMVV